MSITGSGVAGGYTRVREVPLPRLEVTLQEYLHERTGARHLHLASADDNKAFMAVFATAPRDSTGVAHILEHVVLAGSQRFPVRDAFFAMTTRSLATFMNAFTGPDWTAYPFSTRNLKDFWNLLAVYTDAAFRPRLAELSFKQEGWRLEFEDPADPTSGLRYKGVVYNEMKGGFLQAPSLMHHAVTEALLPGTTYEHVSGGDPALIPELTYDGLRGFHAAHYHPGNAIFMSSGDIAINELLTWLDGKVLDGQSRPAPAPSVGEPRRLPAPVEVRRTYPAPPGQDLERGAQVLLAWVVGNAADSFDVLCLQLLSETLLGNPGSPLRKALLESGLGSALADGTGFNPSFKYTVFGAGLKDVRPEDAGRVESMVMETLAGLARDGVDPELVDAALHGLEFQERERSNAGFPHSLRMVLKLLPPSLHGGDPYRTLDLDADLERLAAGRAEGRFFERMIEERLLANTQRGRVQLDPDLEMEAEFREREAARLREIESGLTDQERAAIVADGLRLKAMQETKDDLSVLPTVELEDVATTFSEVPHAAVTLPGAAVELYPQPTNGVTYVELRGDFSTLPPDLLDDLPVLTTVLTRVGAAGQDYAGLARRIAAHTGGVNAGALALNTVSGGSLRWVSLGGKALTRDHEEFWSILSDLVAAPEFERGRLRELIAQSVAESEGSVAAAGHAFARQLAASQLRPVNSLSERIGGLTAIRRQRSLRGLDDAGLDALAERLHAIRSWVLAPTRLDICITSEEEQMEELKELAARFLDRLAQPPGDSAKPLTPTRPRRREACVVASQVAYNAAVYPTVPYDDIDAPSLDVLARYLGTNYLHPEIREKGGAYGAFAVHDNLAGLFSLVSYRDPQVLRTYDIFEAAPSHLAGAGVDGDRLNEAILAACREFDPLESPDIRGSRASLRAHAGLTPEVRAEFQSRLLRVTDSDLLRVSAAYLGPGRGAQASIAGQAHVDAAEAERPGFFEAVEPAW